MSVFISAHPNFVPILNEKENARYFGKSTESVQSGQNFGKSEKSENGKKVKKVKKTSLFKEDDKDNKSGDYSNFKEGW